MGRIGHWRKMEDMKDFIQWYNPQRRINIFVYYQTYMDWVGKKPKWIFEEVIRNKHNELHYSTKEKAMDFARSYMRGFP